MGTPYLILKRYLRDVRLFHHDLNQVSKLWEHDNFDVGIILLRNFSLRYIRCFVLCG